MADLPQRPAEPATEWRTQAACRGIDPAFFFPERGDFEAMNAAKDVCATCTVTADCLEYALVINERDGVFGGTSSRERRRLRSTQHRAPRTIAAGCGTNAGYERHRVAGGPACDACRAAHVAHNAQWNRRSA